MLPSHCILAITAVLTYFVLMLLSASTCSVLQPSAKQCIDVSVKKPLTAIATTRSDEQPCSEVMTCHIRLSPRHFADLTTTTSPDHTLSPLHSLESPGPLCHSLPGQASLPSTAVSGERPLLKASGCRSSAAPLTAAEVISQITHGCWQMIPVLSWQCRRRCAAQRSLQHHMCVGQAHMAAQQGTAWLGNCTLHL